MEKDKLMDMTIKYQEKYGKRGTDSRDVWLLRKRTVNTAIMVISNVAGLDFADFEFALYFRCNDDKVKKFVRAYEGQMEEAAIHPEAFVKNLHSFYLKTCLYIEENHLFRDFFDFCELLECQRRQKIKQGHKGIFDAYLSLLMQQVCYFSRNRMEDSVYGVTDAGDLIFKKNPHPYSDMGAYQLEEQYPDYFKGKCGLTEKQVYQAYKAYGYEIHNLHELDVLGAKVNVYENNSHIMIPYINENAAELLITKLYCHHVPDFPRQWKDTGFYKDKLLHRNYMLPASGITARYANAGDIDTIYFRETIRGNEIILLYKVSTRDNGEYSGYYYTKAQIFYSIFEHTNRSDWHRQVENFILENYMILTCDYDIDKKKNFAIRQVTDLSGFHFPNQPLVMYSYQVETTDCLSGC